LLLPVKPREFPRLPAISIPNQSVDVQPIDSVKNCAYSRLSKDNTQTQIYQRSYLQVMKNDHEAPGLAQNQWDLAGIEDEIKSRVLIHFRPHSLLRMTKLRTSQPEELNLLSSSFTECGINWQANILFLKEYINSNCRIIVRF